MAKLKVVHYVNQMFGGIGAEEKADVGISVEEGAKGPGVAVNQVLGDKGSVVATIICGDNYFAENQKAATEEILKIVEKYKPDIFLSGPAYNAGRYGVACGELAKCVKEKFNIPAVTAMYVENPGTEMYRKSVYIVRTKDRAIGTKEAIEDMIKIALKLINKEPIGRPDVENYFHQGVIKEEYNSKSAAERAVDMLILKLNNKKYTSEIPYDPTAVKVEPAPGVKDLSKATIAFVTDGNLIPFSNPDNMAPVNCPEYRSYSTVGINSFDRGKYRAHHVGYDTSKVNADPNRLVPIDVLREFEKKGVIGKIFETYYTCAGVGAPMTASMKVGKGIAKELKEHGVDGVILTST